ncbi:rab-like protein 3 [Danaus plexippus]|uniref:Rab-like protein 3 n=1 Tax=Danaus plexippus plexippus TaxID=278856 RepID=A0A212EVC0_DANPL|nr:rab-like protein 3 [Danaus plexippus]OWR45411.1 Rab protein 3 [Danaus plexippus plexippus]
MAAIEKVKVVVLGDSGVGKTSLTYLVAHNKPLLSPGWTVGCSVEVKLHKYKEGTQAQNTFFVELWDVGGSNNHRNTRNVFYQPTHGIILVHDLTNRKSQLNLQKWLSEILNQDGTNPNYQHVDVDPEQFLGSTQIPILVIGTKYDLAEEKQRKNQYRRLASSIAEQCGADEIFVTCHQARSLAPGTSNSVKLTRFFDKVIERRYYATQFPDKRRLIPPHVLSTPVSTNKNTHYLSPRFYHMD